MPAHITEQKQRAIRDAIRAGIPVTEIRALLSTSAGTISKVKRAMGIPLRDTRPRQTRVQAEPQAVPPEPTVMHHREIQAYGVQAAPARDEQPAPSQTYTPQEYFEAIATGLRGRDKENSALRDQVSALRGLVARLETDNRRVISDLNQCKLQMANWHGPAALPNKSLGNGG